eukprot:scaffold1308_cov247-Pinguiococcus_pyrenoidosus.AAC.1
MSLRRSDDPVSQRWLLIRRQRFGTSKQKSEPQVFVERVVTVLKCAAKVLGRQLGRHGTG